MSKNEYFDLTYVTIDALSEGVGSSQITPLISRLSKSGLKINLISYEKYQPSPQLLDYFNSIGVKIVSNSLLIGLGEKINLPLDGLTDGVYFIRIIGNISTMTRSFVIQR